MLFYGVCAMLVMKAISNSAYDSATYSGICHKLTVLTVKPIRPELFSRLQGLEGGGSEARMPKIKVIINLFR